MKRILVVEDNQEFREGAERFFSTVDEVQVTYASDHDEAIQLLESEQFDGSLVDCFFPEMTGSGNTDLGRKIADTIAGGDRKKIEDGMRMLAEYVDVNDPDLEPYARNFLLSLQEDLGASPIYRAIKQVGAMLGKVGTTRIAINTFEKAFQSGPGQRRDYFGALISAMENDEANQPLGVNIARRLQELGVPVVLATSTYHHDDLTQPIQDYAGKMRVPLIDCSPGQGEQKASPQFWARAYRALSNLQ